ncbi:hypothetical protein Tco_0375458 [Tanacetum coccineum]
MESNKSIYRSNEQKNLYKALVDAYKSDKLILDTYGDTVSWRSDQAEDAICTYKDLEEPQHQPPTPDRDWNKTLPNAYGPVQPWLSSLAQMEDLRESFNELMDTPLDFSTFMMNRLKVDTLTPELFSGPTFELMKGTCKSLVKLEYFFEEVYKATTEKLDWNNAFTGQNILDILRQSTTIVYQTLTAIVIVIPFDHFITMNSLRILCSGVSSQNLCNFCYEDQRLQIYVHINGLKSGLKTMWMSIHEVLSSKGMLKYLQMRLSRVTKRISLTFTMQIHTDSDLNTSDGTLDDVRTALNDRLKGIRMEYLPQKIWRQSDRE